MNADAQAQVRLLELQEQDTRLSQLDHRSRTLPEAQQLADVQARLDRVRDEMVAARVIAEDLQRDQARADSDVQQVRERARRDQEMLDSGGIGDPRQLQNLQHELQSLARRQSELEDVELEIMERVEGAVAAVQVLAAQADELAAEGAALSAVVQDLQASIAEERAASAARRSSIASEIPADLLGLYEKIRADAGGVGAAHLHRGQCEGCRLQLPPHELERARSAPSSEVIRCEECRRILVRTEESGLSA